MLTNLSMQNWLDCLRSLQPAKGVLHVGAGQGSAVALYADWGITNAVFVDAEKNVQPKLAKLLQSYPDWSHHAALLSDQEGEKAFYLASNPNENGIFPPESLTGLWRNLKTREKRLLNAITLESFLENLAIDPQCLNWLVVDCLPALPVIQGAGKFLDDWDIILARVILDTEQLPNKGASKAELDELLTTQGFRCIAYQEELQPAIGNALYARDWKALLLTRLAGNLQLFQQTVEAQTQLAADRLAQLGQANAAKDEQAKLAVERLAQTEQLTKASDEQAKLAADRLAQLGQANAAKDEQAKLAAERLAQLEQANKAKEEQAKLAADRLVQLGQANAAKDEQAKLAADRLAQLGQANTAKDEQAKLAADRLAQLGQANAAKDEQAKLAAERKVEIERNDKVIKEQAERIAQLEVERAGLEFKQRLLNQEMTNVEIQIDLVKDLLVRGLGL